MRRIKASHNKILKWGSEQFTPAIVRCKFSAIRSLLLCSQELTAKFVTIPETGDNRFIFQPIFQNENLMYGKSTCKRKKIVTFQQVDFDIPSQISITINKVFNHEIFISYKDLCEKICYIHKNGSLALKYHLVSILNFQANTLQLL